MKISSGTPVVDSLLDGGFESDTISIVYGSGGTGKTNLCLQAAISAVLLGKKVIYVDTEGGCSHARICQLEGFREDITRSIMYLKPTTFEGQKKAFLKLRELVCDSIGLIIVDSIAMLYRLEIGKGQKTFELNRELGRQIADLAAISRKKNIPVLITNQVYSAMDGTEDVVMVGGDLLRYQSKCLIELSRLNTGERVAKLKKHRSLPEKEARFEIVEKGIIKM